MNLPVEVGLLANLGHDAVRLFRASVLAVTDEQVAITDPVSGSSMACDWLDNGGPRPQAGAAVLVCLLPGEARGIVLGIVRTTAAPPRTALVEASESLTLACGESSLTLQADGKVLLKGDDVVVRAKGTKRIRAGHVAIN